MAWTGLVCAALWSLAALVRFVATFLAVAALHAAWDSIGGLLGYLTIGAVSVGWLLWRLHSTRTVRYTP